MKLRINLEKLNDSVAIPISEGNEGLQIRHDGILINGNLHLWEEIILVTIINDELLDKHKSQ